MTILSATPKGKVYSLASPDVIEGLYSEVIDTIILSGGSIQRHYKATTGSIYIDATVGDRIYKIRLSTHSRRIRSSGQLKPVRPIIGGFAVQIMGYASLALFKSLIKQ